MNDYSAFIKILFKDTELQYVDVAIRKTNSKIKWKKNDVQTWIRKILGDSTLKRNHIFHYLTLTQRGEQHEINIEKQKHYLEVYENMPMWWKKIGALIRKIR